MKLAEFLDKAWERYCKLTPDAPRVHALLEKRGEQVINDHIAFRTFNLPGINRFDVGAIFEKWGYVKSGDDLDFPEKKLKANYWLHADETLPKVFISELILEQVSGDLKNWIVKVAGNSKYVSQAGKGLPPEALLEPTWNSVSIDDYRRFYPESEYAAWTAAYGIQLNHFTVSINHLKTFEGIQELNAFLLENGFELNDAGGMIKGTPKDLLEQSSTRAREVDCVFEGGVTHRIPGCYYEFAKRYPDSATGKLFEGFIPKSADKIFESTFEKRSHG